MTPTVALILTCIMIVLSGFFSGSEIAFVQSSRVRMAIDDATKGGFIDRIIRLFTKHEDMFISTMLVGNNGVLVIYGITISILINGKLGEWFEGNEALVLICNTLISTFIILLAGEFLPKAAFKINPNKTIRVLALPLYLIFLILSPIAWLVSGITVCLKKLFGIKDPEEDKSSSLTMEQLDDYIEETIENVHNPAAVENEVKIFRNAMDFKDTQMSECMIPRNEIVAVSMQNTSFDDIRRKFVETGLSKIVVYREDIDDIAGYIHISELFNTGSDWRKCLKPVIYTPDTMLANKMMRKMIAEKKSMVIVVDEFGGTAGLATLEDLVEEIFGEIEDEHDQGRSWGRVLPDGGFEFSGRAEVEAVNEEFGLDLKESEDYHTIAGYLLDHLGRMPEEGEEEVIGAYRFKVTKMAAMKILEITVHPFEGDR